MLHIFFKKEQSKRYTTIKFCHSYYSNEKDLTVVFNLGLSQAINKLFLISKFKLLESLDRTVKSLKFMLQ